MKNGKSKLDIAVIQTEITDLKSQLSTARADTSREIQDVRTSVDKILENHLPHIYDSLSDIKVKMAYYIGIATGIAILVSHFWKT